VSAASDAPGVALDLATRLDGDGGRYSARLSRAWEIWGPNGGYLAAIALRAAGSQAELEQPASFNCHFLRSPDFGRVELDVTFLKRSRRSEALAVRMTQQGKLVLEALVRTAAEAPGYEHQKTQAPDVLPPAALKTTDELWAEHERPPFPFWNNIERRPIDQSRRLIGQSTTTEPGAPVVREWARFRPKACFDDPFVDAARSLVLLDTYGWPAAYRMHPDGPYIAPNLDTSAWFHRFSPRSAWLLIDHECLVGHRGLLGVSGRVWNTDGQLLATGSAQLCCLPAPQG
jgi:acyl-CoA thioesterase